MKKTFLLSLAVGLLSSCGREQTRTYQVPKEQASPVLQAPTMNAAPVQPAGNGFSAELPEGWAEKSGSGMRIVSYVIEGSSVDFYLISLSMGDVSSNVNRWRGQVGLADATPEEIAQDVETLRAGGHAMKYIEIYNEDGGKGIIAAIIDLSPKYWYFTAKGSVDELKAHASDIRSFLESIQFEGHNH